jgi:tetratricopeptide (TPR) repeat protein
MNRSDFINMMSQTGTLSRQSLGEVYELVDIFPYFQSAHLLLLKGLHDNADVKFESQLRNSAIHIADREVLYYLLSDKPAEAVEPGKETTETRIPEAAEASETEQTVIESARNSIELISEFERITDMPQNQDDQDQEEESIFYMDPGFSLPEQEDLLELDLDSSKDYDEDDNAIETEVKTVSEGRSGKQLQADLIDRFIIANPRIEPNREKTNVPVEDISKPYTEEKGGFVTETLARIYVSQGYYSKAIDIYEKLSLKFPEKSSYFASQIEKVKEHIKN